MESAETISSLILYCAQFSSLVLQSSLVALCKVSDRCVNWALLQKQVGGTETKFFENVISLLHMRVRLFTLLDISVIMP